MKVPLLAVALVVAASGTVLGDVSFQRADSNLSGAVDLSDAVFTLNVLFLGEPRPGCDDAMDADDNGAIEITDAIYKLNFLFLGGPAPNEPFPDCGPDPTPDEISCDAYPLCEGVEECFGQEDLDAAIEENVAPVVCTPVDITNAIPDIGTVTVCPSGEAAPCGEEAELGCPVSFTTVEGTLDVENQEVRAHVEGAVEGLPLLVDTPLGSTVCTVDITFSADVVVPFITEEDLDGRLVLVELLPAILEDDEVTLTADGGLLCDLLENLQEQFIDELRAQLEESAGDLLAELNAELIGAVLCTEA